MSPRRIYFGLTGILSRPLEKWKPLLPTILRTGDFYPINYSHPYFDAQSTCLATALRVRSALERGYEAFLLGGSLGGTLVPGTKHELIKLGVPTELVPAIILDSPMGGSTMKEIPEGMMPMMTWATQLKVPNWLSPLGTKILDGNVKGPKPQNVDVPEGVDREEYMQRVITESMEGLRGHDFRDYWSQLHWLLSRDAADLPFDALKGADVTYIACTGDNETVRQPEAMELWRPHVTRIVEIETAHFALLEQRRKYEKLFAELLAV